MPKLFNGFDFALLDDPDFREDSVREALVVPLLAALGFTESPPYRIIRSRPLTHPYVYIGTAKKGITIIPDYLLERDGENAWILDAKAPNENIDSGKNVEQAYSYAIHPDYGVCNGRKLVVFHIGRAEPVIDIALPEISRIWPMVVGILGCRSAWPNGIAPGFSPDFGLAVAKAGLSEDKDGKKYYHILMSVAVMCACKMKDEQPYTFLFAPPDTLTMMIVGDLGDKTYTNENESYRPFIAEEFVLEPEGVWRDEQEQHP